MSLREPMPRTTGTESQIRVNEKPDDASDQADHEVEIEDFHGVCGLVIMGGPVECRVHHHDRPVPLAPEGGVVAQPYGRHGTFVEGDREGDGREMPFFTKAFKEFPGKRPGAEIPDDVDKSPVSG